MANKLPLIHQFGFVVWSLQEENLSYHLDCCVESSQEETAFWTMTDGGENLDELFGSSMPRLLRVADCILHNYHDSEDALQDGLLSALRHIDQFKGNSQFSTWLFSIIRNSALAKLRKQRAHPFISMDEHGLEEDAESGTLEIPADPRPDPERGCAQTELSYQVAQTLEGLPVTYRAIIWLCDFEGFSGKEAAQRLGLSVSALKAQHHRARRAIRELMGAHAARRSS
jgi:RNA polymerase sigma-70 factor (ECF subfamily)